MNDTRKQVRIPWTHTKLTHYTADKTLNAVWSEVAAAEDRWITFLSFSIPVGMTAKIDEKPVMRFKVYKADGTEQFVTADMMLAMQKVGKAMVTEICPLGYYGRWYHNSWLEQINVELREHLEIDTGYFYTILFAGETLLFQVKNSGVILPSTPHASTLLEFDIDVITDADLKRAGHIIPTIPPVSARFVETEQDKEQRKEGIQVIG